MESRQMKIRHLKGDKNTDWLSYQRKLPKELVNKAKQLGIKGTLVRPPRFNPRMRVDDFTELTEFKVRLEPFRQALCRFFIF